MSKVKVDPKTSSSNIEILVPRARSQSEGGADILDLGVMEYWSVG